jgi:hypothetical protein
MRSEAEGIIGRGSRVKWMRSREKSGGEEEGLIRNRNNEEEGRKGGGW